MFWEARLSSGCSSAIGIERIDLQLVRVGQALPKEGADVA